MTKDNFLECLSIIEEDLKPKNQKGLSSQLQFAVALRFFAEGGYMKPIGDLHGVSRFTAARCIHRVAKTIVHHKNDFIQWCMDENSIKEEKKAFYDYYSFEGRYIGMPGVLGAIDGTHIKIATPHVNESIYVNRKSAHSINTQIVCNCNLEILDMDCSWPGSTHDAFILRNSDVWDVFEESTAPKGWILGDQGYMLKPWLLTPINMPKNAAENRYNRAHKRARSVVERCNGVLKSRFRCLGGVLQFSPRKSKSIIKACGCLHNFATKRRIPLVTDPISEADNANGVFNMQHDESEGRVTRDNLIENYFQ